MNEKHQVKRVIHLVISSEQFYFLPYFTLLFLKSKGNEIADFTQFFQKFAVQIVAFSKEYYQD